MTTGAHSLTRSTVRIELPLRGAVEEKVFTMQIFPPQIVPDSMMTFRPFSEKNPKPENLLKTQGRERRFSSTKPDNILIKKQLSQSHGNAKIA
jgi:hypothetical protein